MKRFLLAASILAELFVLTNAQQRTAKKEPEPTRLAFAALRDYINEYDKRRVGDRIVVSDVPLPTSSQKYELTGMFILEAGSDDGVQLFTSSALAQHLRPHLQGGGAVRARITCTVIEFRGKFDISMAAFVTKVEAVDADGAVLWVEIGPPPSRLRYRT